MRDVIANKTILMTFTVIDDLLILVFQIFFFFGSLNEDHQGFCSYIIFNTENKFVRELFVY